MEVPKIEKIVVNMGVGDAVQNTKVLDDAVEELQAITVTDTHIYNDFFYFWNFHY
jgi:ribosomal protein L5